MADAVMTTDAACRVRYMNPVAEALTGWTRASAEGRTLGQLFEVLDPLSGSNELKTGEGALECLAAGPTYLLRCTDGRELHVKFSISPLSDSQGRVNGAVFAFHDVSREWALTKKLVYQARHDSLTGLPNRSEFEARVRDALSHCQSQQMCHAVLYLDLDQFKLVNDTCGHPVGDRLLKQVSGRLRAAIGPGDIVARLGGDEFGVLIYDCSEEEAAEVGERLRNEVDSFRFTHADKAFDLGVSIGCVVLDEHSGSLSDILSVADMACYAAKERGRNCVHIYGADDELIAHRHREMAWSGRLRHALENHQLTLCAQRIRPCNNDGSPELVEFLLRLTEADGQSTLPMAFIPAAERYDLMPRIDRWVILEAFAAIRRLERLGERATYSINLSGQSMGDAELAQFVIDQLAMHRISPRRVCFEITETAAISNLTEALRFVHRLRAIGCRFALDDFGAGVSSFGYLRHLSPDFLKIDGQFVRDIADDPVDRALLETIVNVGKVLGIQTIAEWVEDEPTLNVLREIDVDYVQGFHVGRPTPVEMWDHKIPMPAVATA
ncbi:MAG: EAL domain-containing protein [Pseudomonadota bacterium]